MDIDDIYLLYRNARAITTDTRRMEAGSVFLALRGESFDGNLFAVKALENGCRFAIVDTEPTVLDPSGKYVSRLIKTADTLSVYKEIARRHRREYDIPVIGITGTNGKTTTKELLSAVLATAFNVLSTEGNHNNDIGVPQTLLRLSGHDIAVVEMGASHPGDIKTLVETAEPTCGLITNVGKAHLAGFGSFEGVKKTKGELYDFLALNHLFAFVNQEDKDLAEMARERQLRTVDYVHGEVSECSPYLSVRLEGGNIIRTKLIGAYNLANVLAAVSVGRHFGVSCKDIKSAIEAYEPRNNRSQLVITSDNELIVDAYNANPSSMAVAVDNFAKTASPRPKKLILGDMAELGDASEEEHQKLVDALSDKGFSDVWLVGAEFSKIETGFRRFQNVEDVKAEIAKEKPRGECILVKGSHSVRLYELAALL